MATPTLNMMDAYRLETLLSKGIDKHELITALKEKDLEALITLDDSFDYHDLLQQPEEKITEFEEAVFGSYAISYLTINGLRNLLRLKYGFKEEVDYTLSSKRLDHLPVDSNQLEEIKLLVGSVWKVQENDKDSNSTHISIIHTSLVN